MSMANQYTYLFSSDEAAGSTSHRVIASLALAKPTPKASSLFRHSGFF
jgi:hypothetical protein